MIFICYPKCSTCKNAQKFLEDHQIEFDLRDIKKDNPTSEELKHWHQLSQLELKKFFNTSGEVYKSLNLKDKLKDLSEDEMYQLLAANGMLVKRPILVGEDFVLVGFKMNQWLEKLT